MARVVVNAAKMARGMETNRMMGVARRWKRLDMLYPMDFREQINNVSWTVAVWGIYSGAPPLPHP